jgi:ParB family chromosome partitioning protein
VLIKIADILVKHENNVSRDDFTPETCQELAATIEKQGLLQNLVVRRIEDEQYKYQLVCGYRRMTAIGILAWTEVDCNVGEMTEEEGKICNIVENMERLDLTYWEQCSMLNRTFDSEMSDLEISRVLVGRSRGWVRNRWALWKLPDEVIKYVELGFFSAADVNMLLSKTEEEQKATAALMMQGKEEGMTTQELAEKYSGRKAIRPKKQVHAMMTILMEKEKMEHVHCLRWALGEISDTLLLEMIE